jgi:ATP-dependent DNA ligase
VSKRLGSPYVSGRTRHWLKFKNPAAPKRNGDELFVYNKDSHLDI